MPFAVFQNENLAAGLPQRSTYQVGVSDVDDGTRMEQGITLPWPSESKASYVYYDCWIECELDSGIVVHRQLPQYSTAADSLGVADMFNTGLETITKQGVNTISAGRFTDTTQRMAHSIYRFCLRGIALRIGYQVPIPKLLTVGGVTAIPDDEIKQKAYNKIVGNYSGVPMWKAEWSQWYTVAAPPITQQLPPPNLAEHIRASDTLPAALQAPWSEPDDDAVPSAPPLGNIVRG